MQPKDLKIREWRRAPARGREREKERTQEAAGRGEEGREGGLWLLLLRGFSSPWACPMQTGLSQECCLLYLRSSLLSSDLLPLFYFRGLFPPLSFSHCHFGLLFPILTTKWQPTPVFLPGESQGQGSLVSCRLWGCGVGHD